MPTPKEQLQWAQILAQEKQQSKKSIQQNIDQKTAQLHASIDDIQTQMHQAVLAHNTRMLIDLVEIFSKVRAQLALLQIEYSEQVFGIIDETVVKDALAAYTTDCVQVATLIDKILQSDYEVSF